MTILLMCLAMFVCYLYENRYGLHNKIEKSKHTGSPDEAESNIVDKNVDSMEIDATLRAKLIGNVDAILEEFSEDLKVVYGEMSYRDRFETDRQKWLRGEWAPPGIEVLLRDIRLAKRGCVTYSNYLFGFKLGCGNDGQTAVAYRHVVEMRLRESGKNVKLYLLPTIGGGSVDFRPNGEMVFEHQFYKYVDSKTIKTKGKYARPW